MNDMHQHSCMQGNDIDSLLLYHMQWLRDVFLWCILDWEAYVKQLPGTPADKEKLLLSAQTREGLKMTGE